MPNIDLVARAANNQGLPDGMFAPANEQAISINVTRGQAQFSPEAVEFEIDFSAASFDTTFTTAEGFDAKNHLIFAKWNMGVDGDHTYLGSARMLPGNRARRTATGLKTGYVFQAGTYNIQVRVYEPASGKWGVATTNITVGAQDDLFPTTQTICVNPVGDTDFTGAPTGALERNQDDIFNGDGGIWDNLISNANVPMRLLFKRDATYNMRARLDGLSDPLRFFMSDYGPGAELPIINYAVIGSNPISNQDMLLTNTPAWRGTDGSDLPTMVIENLDLRSNFDGENETPLEYVPTGGANAGHRVSRPFKYGDFIVSNCKVSGFPGGAFYQNMHLSSDGSKRAMYAIQDVQLTNVGGQYPFMTAGGAHTDTTEIYLGVAFEQSQNMLDTSHATSGEIRAAIRSNSPTLLIVGKSSFFGYDHDNAAIKLNNTPRIEGTTTIAFALVTEWGRQFTVGGNNSDGLGGTGTQNAFIDRCIHIAGYGADGLFYASNTGTMFNNCIAVMPDILRLEGNFGRFGGIEFGSVGVNQPNAANAPNRAVNCAIVSDRSLANNNGNSGPSVAFSFTTTGEEEANNIALGEVWTDEDTGLTVDTATVLMQALTSQYRPGDTKVADVSFAAPADAVKRYSVTGTPKTGALFSPWDMEANWIDPAQRQVGPW